MLTAARSILVIKTHDQLGDFLVAMPALAALRARYPAARITLVTRSYLAPLARRQVAADSLLVLPDVKGGRGYLSFARGMARLAPDAAFVFNSVSRSRTADLVAALSSAGVVVGRSVVGAGPVGQDAPLDPIQRALETPSRDPVYDLDVPIGSRSVHQVDRVLDLVRASDVPIALSPRPVLALGQGERAAGVMALAGDTLDTAPRVGLHPAAANALKCWPVDLFAELGARLARGGAALFVFDTPREPGPARALLAGLAGRGVAAMLVPAGLLDAFVPRVAALDLMICNDSGVMHIAAALGVATLSFHSLGRPEEWAPRNETAIALHAEPIAGIGVDDAERAARRLLGTIS
jgi:heptosyltransferase-2